jgi:predicted amidohydrolase YtcJ
VTEVSAPRTTLLMGGNVHSPADPFATAMLVEGDTVAWVGSDGAARMHLDSVDEVVHLDGALVAPAFVDAHVHTTQTGLARTSVDLAGATSRADALDRLARWARDHPGEPVWAHGWDESAWPDPVAPSRAEVDRAVGDVPAFVGRADGHSAVVSSGLLARVGARADLPDPAGLPGWSPTGPLARQAHAVAYQVAHRLVVGTRRRDLQRQALRHAAAMGIATVHEMAGPDTTGDAGPGGPAGHLPGAEDLAGLLDLVAAEPLPTVVPYWAQPVTDPQTARDLVATHRVAGLGGDLSVDGSLGSHTASVRTPYDDAPGERGHRYLDVDTITAHLVATTRAQVQAGFHVIGDAGLDAVLEGLRRAEQVVGLPAVRAGRHRLEHVEMPDEDAVRALAGYGVLLSVQPAFDARWGGRDGMYARRLGPARAQALNPLAALVGAGVPLAFGSDSPVTAMDPWATVRAAAFHHTPTARLTVRAAFAAHTRGGWRAVGQDAGGVLAPGAPASYAIWTAGDLVIQTPDERVAAWSTDPRAGVPGLPDLTPGQALPRCLRTVSAGRVIYDTLGGAGR